MCTDIISDICKHKIHLLDLSGPILFHCSEHASHESSVKRKFQSIESACFTSPVLKSSGNLEPTAKVVGDDDDGTTPSLSSPTCISGLDSNEVFPTTLSSSTATDVIISANPSVLLGLPVETKKVPAENISSNRKTGVEVLPSTTGRPTDLNLKKTGGPAVDSKSMHNTMVDDEKTMKRLVKSSNNLTCTLLGFGESLSMASTPKSSPYSFRPKRAKSDEDFTTTHKDPTETRGSSNGSGKGNQDSSEGSGQLPLSDMVKEVTSPRSTTVNIGAPDSKKNATPKKPKVPSPTNLVVRVVPNDSLITSSFSIRKRSSNNMPRQNPFGQLPNIAYKCNCKKSGCLKLYCDCFRFSQRCGDECNCM